MTSLWFQWNYRVVEEEDMAPLIVDKEKEGEDSDDEAGDDEHHHDQPAVHLSLLHRRPNIKDTPADDFKDTAQSSSLLFSCTI